MATINPMRISLIRSLLSILNWPLDQWKMVLKNDFEDSVFVKFPEIKNIKETLYDAGALYASMSGSGSSVFGVFENEQDLRSQFNKMSYWSGKLNI